VSGTPTARIIVVTGKGGVGKTTVAAATAVAASRTQRALVLSTDPAHSLGDVLGVRLGDDAHEIAPGLVARQLDTRAALERSWPAVSVWLADVLGLAGIGRLEAEELAVVPGLDEVFALAELEAHARSGDHDVIVVDCAPTAEALRLLSLPDVVSRYADRLAVDPIGLASTAVPAIARLLGLPIPPDGALQAVAGLRERLAGVRALLADPTVTTARVVLTPERVVLAEARRTATYLHLFGYALDAVVLNRTLPAGVRATWAEGWRRRQADVRAEAVASFAPVPVLEHPLAAEEPIGVDALGAFADECYGDRDAVARLAEVAPWTFEERDGALVVALRVPGVDGSEVDLGVVGDELLVAVGPHRRAVALPAGLRRRTLGSARLVDGRLEVTFLDA
jgi:arsenite/tail-anchored protein-transporting ATPase